MQEPIAEEVYDAKNSHEAKFSDLLEITLYSRSMMRKFLLIVACFLVIGTIVSCGTPRPRTQKKGGCNCGF
jgi:hypothetical protein